MVVNWDEVKKIIIPIKDYEDLCRRLCESFTYVFVRNTFNFSMPELVTYAQKLLGGDSRNRYIDYASSLTSVLTELHQVGVQNVIDLHARTASRKQLEIFVDQSGISAPDIITVLKYLIYWFIPNKKYLSGLVRDNPQISDAIKVLGEFGIRTNLELLQKGITAKGRMSLAETSGLPIPIISELVNRADFSRMPWASKATISNIIGAGYSSLDQLITATPGQLYEDFFHYGMSIGKNLKFGNEIENSYRIAIIIPVLIQRD